MILAGDIGGTHTRLAVFDQKMVCEKKYTSKNYHGLEEIVCEFLSSQKTEIHAACFGVPGPVHDQVCKTTNLPWIVDGKKIKAASGIQHVCILNDLEAHAHGLQALKTDEIAPLNVGEKRAGNRALIAAGTGLGEAGLYWDGKKYCPFACEGGHADFAPRTEDEIDLFRFLKEKYSHVSYERVVSGPGLHAVYEFLVASGKVKFTAEVAKAADPAAAISELAMRGNGSCMTAVDWFLSIYGAEAGNLALKFLSLGGLYIGGGIAPKLLKQMKAGSFMRAFCDKGRFHELLRSMPVYVVMNEDTALLGAASFAREFR